MDRREDSLDPRDARQKGNYKALVSRGLVYSSGPWPSYYLVNFILSCQYSSFPKAVLSIRVTIPRRAGIPPPMKSEWALGSVPSLVAFLCHHRLGCHSEGGGHTHWWLCWGHTITWEQQLGFRGK